MPDGNRAGPGWCHQTVAGVDHRSATQRVVAKLGLTRLGKDNNVVINDYNVGI
jgi:hypothetical protein